MPKPNRGHGRVVEKPKDFKSAIKRLIKELKNQKKLLIISCILAMLGSVLSIIAPNRLSKLTDEITKGLMVNQKNMTALTQKTTANLDKDNLKEILSKTLMPNIDENTLNEIFSSNTITNEDKQKVKDILKNENKENVIYKLKELPDEILEKLFTNTTYNDIEITKEDKINLLKAITPDITKINLPRSYQNIIFKEIKIKKTPITSNEQYKYLKIISTLKKDTKPEEIYKKIDKMPKNIQKLIKPTMNIEKIKQISILMLMLYLTSTIFNFTQQTLMATLTNKFATNLRGRISKKIN